MNTIYILILVVASGVYGGYSPTVTTQEFSSESHCLNAVRMLQTQQEKINSSIRVASYVCVPKGKSHD